MDWLTLTASTFAFVIMVIFYAVVATGLVAAVLGL